MSIGRQRSQAADDAITAAALDVLREHGYRGLTMSAVIERSGVSSATLYRRWPTKEELVIAALRTLTPEVVPSDTGSLAGDVESFLRTVARAVERRDDLFVGLSIEVQFNQELRDMAKAAFVTPRRAQIRAILERAVERGELPSTPPLDLVLSLATGPLMHRAFTLGEKLSPSFLRAVTASVVAGLRQ